MATSAALARTVPRRIAITSVLALGLVAALIGWAFWLKDHIATRTDLYTDVDTILLDLHTLSQRTALLAIARLGERGESSQPTLDQRLLADLHDMAHAHRQIMDGEAIRQLPPAVREAYRAPPRHVDRAVMRHLEVLSRIATTERPVVERTIADASGTLAYNLDRVLREHRLAQHRELSRLDRLERNLVALTVAVLLLELVFVFRPMARRVQEGFDELLRVYEAFRLQSLQDELTGLDNRKVLMAHLERPLTEPHGLLLVDLDDFRAINAAFGHAAGDRTLIAIAGAIKAEVGGEGLVVRLAGDQFTILTRTAVTPRQAAVLADRLLGAIDDACPQRTRRLGLSASIGIALFPDTDTDPTRLLGNADLALQEAKAQGRHRWRLFTPAMREPVELRQTIEVAFRQALWRDELVLHYQPQVDLCSGRVIGLEGLARWQRPDGELLGPNRFIPFIEQTPLVIEMGERLLDVALDQQRALHRLGLHAGPIALNVADLQLRQPDFAAMLLERLERAGLGPEAIAVEVVERAFVAHGQELIARQLLLLANAGVTVELDDFGTGHASLTHLKTFPVRRIKIDRSFVDGIGRDPGDETIVRATIDIARSMDRRVIAEGIETEAQRRFLIDHGCPEGQGYLIARPLAPPQLVDWLRAHRAATRPNAVAAPALF
ncbi:MAG: putative bifunctional diguanylate cyclase/phosphodiesterase [Pseudomonadota bacterium]